MWNLKFEEINKITDDSNENGGIFIACEDNSKNGHLFSFDFGCFIIDFIRDYSAKCVWFKSYSHIIFQLSDLISWIKDEYQVWSSGVRCWGEVSLSDLVFFFGS